MMGAVDHLIRLAITIALLTAGGVAFGLAFKALVHGVVVS